MRVLTVLFQAILLLSLSLATNSQSMRTSPIAVGDMAPDFALEDQHGQKVMLSETRGKSPIVLVFYRGYWGPYCARQLAGLRFLLRKGEKVRLYAISVDPPEASKSFAEKIASDGKGELGLPLLSDRDHKTIDAYGLRDPAYEGRQVYGIPHAAVYVIDKKGRVAWAKIESNYRERPTNEDIRAALDALK